MEVEGMDLVALLEGGPVPQLPDDLDDLFTDDLLQFLTAPEAGETTAKVEQQGLAAPVPVVAACPAATAPSASSSSSPCEVPPSPPSPVPAPSPPACVPSASLAPMQLQSTLAVPRLVTTAAAQQMWTAMLQAAYGAAPAVAMASPACHDEAKARCMQPAGTSLQASRDCSADSSDTDQDDHDMVDSKAKGAGNKRKAPEVDWRQIEDPAERRRQRRLAKNRVTAARSRERKKAMWSELEEKLKNIENENAQLRAMLEQFARENASLKSQLLTFTRAGATAGGVAGVSQARAGKTMDPAAVLPVFIVTLLVVCSLLPGDKACALLGSVLPIALLASMLGGNVESGGKGAPLCFDSLFRLLHMLGTLVSGSSKILQRSFKSLFFDRHRHLGRKWMQRLAEAAQGHPVCHPGIGNPVHGVGGNLRPDADADASVVVAISRGGAAGDGAKAPATMSLLALQAMVKVEPEYSG